jgi:catecholate siderophore receptor
LRNLFRMGMTSRDSVITAPRFAAGAPGTVINRQFQSRDQIDTVLANQTDLTSRFETGQLDHTLVTGLEVAIESSENYGRAASVASTTDIFNPNPDDPFLGTISRNGAVARADSKTVSLYAFDTMKLGEQWQFSGGLRFDHFAVKFRSVNAGGVRADLDNYDDTLSWRTGLVYKPRANGSIYFGYGTSFNPSAEGLTLGTGAGNSANVDAEKSQTFELGTKWNFFEEGLSVSSAIFRTEKTNARTTDPVTGDIVIDGEQYVQGIELGAAGCITDDWQVFAGYTYMVSEITASGTAADVGKELPNTPEQSFNLWTTYQLPWGIELGGGAQFVDTRYSSNANTRQVDGYMLYDAMIGYRINKNFDVRLNIYNLADSTYIDRVGGGHVIPGAGRSAVLTANFKF